LSRYSELDKYLIHEETVIKHWTFKGWKIYATSIRLILSKQGRFSRQIIDAPYRFISSVELGRQRPLERMVGTIIFLIAGFVLMYLGYLLPDPYIVSPQLRLPLENLCYLFWFIGIVCIVWFLIGVQQITLHVMGRKPIAIPRELTDVVNLIRDIPQYLAKEKPMS
jgi:hypothetical protein